MHAAPGPLRAAAAPILLLAAIAVLLAVQLRTPAEARKVPALPVRLSPDAQVMLGATTAVLARDSYQRWTADALSSIDDLERVTRKHLSVVMWFADWAHVAQPDLRQLQQVAARGSLPEITWEPWDSSKGLNVSQPAYRLKAIYNGRYDAYIHRWARALAAYAGPVRLRLAHEMNGNWYPWAEASNGNHPGDFVKMWRHVHDIFAAEGVTNVQWVWSPVALHIKPSEYPGDAFVDRLGLSGFVGGVQLRFAPFRGFSALFGPSLDILAAIAPAKPEEISELGVSGTGGDKPSWIQGMFRALPRWPRVHSVIWFNLRKQSDWRIQSSPAAAEAYARGAAAPRYGQRTAYPGTDPNTASTQPGCLGPQDAVRATFLGPLTSNTVQRLTLAAVLTRCESTHSPSSPLRPVSGVTRASMPMLTECSPLPPARPGGSSCSPSPASSAPWPQLTFQFPRPANHGR